jgi:hypothetical protein
MSGFVRVGEGNEGRGFWEDADSAEVVFEWPCDGTCLPADDEDEDAAWPSRVGVTVAAVCRSAAMVAREASGTCD